MRPVLAIILLLIGAPALAQDPLPAQRDPYLVDSALILDPEQAQILRDGLIAMHDQLGFRLSVLTLETHSGLRRDVDETRFDRAVFDRWGRDLKDYEHRSAILVISRKQRRSRLILGAEIGEVYHEAAENIRFAIVDPLLRQNRFEQAVTSGVRAAHLRLIAPLVANEAPPAAYHVGPGGAHEGAARALDDETESFFKRPDAEPAALPSPEPKSRTRLIEVGGIGVALVLWLLFAIVQRVMVFQRWKNRQCPRCGERTMLRARPGSRSWLTCRHCHWPEEIPRH